MHDINTMHLSNTMYLPYMTNQIVYLVLCTIIKYTSLGPARPCGYNFDIYRFI